MKDHEQVIKQLNMALTNLCRAVTAADLRVSLTVGANINQALQQAGSARQTYSAWLLSERT